MSAILGVFNRAGKPVTATDLDTAMDALTHYGSEGSVWVSGVIGLGTQMLRMTPESAAETLPFTVENLTITADARIDNRTDLFAALSVPHEQRTTMPDSVLILRAYQKWGNDCPRYLIGDYAFAIWNASEQTLFCVRDHIGARPFYYYVSDECFAFATDLRALIALDAVPATIDEAEIARYLLGHGYYVENVYTFFKNVYKLTFGHSLVVNREHLRTARYWSPADVNPIQMPSFDDYSTHLFKLVEQAVEARLRTVLPVGAHLSGGLDSSSVAVLASHFLRQQGRSLTVFAWSPPPGDHPDKNEHFRIEAVCRKEGLKPLYTETTVEDRHRFRDVDISVTPIDTVQREAVVQRKAAAQGIRLMLTGWGGDEFVSFNGRGLAAEWFTHGHWLKLARYLNLQMVPQHPRQLKSSAVTFWEKAVIPLLPDALYNLIAPEQRFIPTGMSFIDPAFAQRIKPLIRPQKLSARTMTNVHATQARLYEDGHLTARIESWTAIASEYGITYAHPLLDRRLMEYVLAIPGDLHVCGELGRYLYSVTMLSILPEALVWDDVKEDRALKASGRLTPEEQARERELWQNDERLKQPNPWVNMPLLREALNFGNAQALTGDGIGRAFKCLTIWQHRQNMATMQKTQQ